MSARWSRLDTLVVAGAVALVVVAGVVGQALNAAGRPIVLPFPPIIATLAPHVGWGTPTALGCVVAAVLLARHADRLRWGRLVILGWLLNLVWLVSLALVDGLHRGWVSKLTDPNEYLAQLDRVGSPSAFLRTFTDFIAFGPGVTGDNVWTTHIAAHPPLATLVFWALDRVGLAGGFWAGALCILVSSAAAVAVPVTLRELGAPDAARRLVPFAAVFPGAVWMAVSADGLFAGVAAGGLALACRGAARRRFGASVLGGLLLGAAVYLNYGLVLLGLVVVAALVLTVRARGQRATVASAVLPWALTAGGALLVAALHTAAGFDWFTGLAELRVRYYQGIASDRPYSYFVWANLAAWLVACSPLLAVGVVRAVRVLLAARRRVVSTRGGGGSRGADGVAAGEGLTVAVVALAGVAAALLADLSGMSKAETERIWLAFGVVAYAALALLRGRAATLALLGCGGWALLVNHLLRTGW